ncbi:MAG: class I SAM-dependent methyltransferase [Candidatus Omnitrophota bacterium]
MNDPVREQKERERRLRETTMAYGEFTLLKTVWWNLIELDNVLMRLALKPKGALLDVGCSDGRLIERLRRKGLGGLWCVGTDFAVNPLKKMLAKNIRALAVAADATLPLFKPATFDTVVSLGVVQQLASREERLRILRCMCRVLRSDGQFAVTVLNRPSWASLVANGLEGPLLSSPELFVHLYEPESLRADLEAAGFEVVEIVAINNLPVRYLKRIGFLGVWVDMFITKYMKTLSASKGRYLLAVGRKRAV